MTQGDDNSVLVSARSTRRVWGCILYAARSRSENPGKRIVDMMEAPEQAINILMLQVVGVSRDTCCRASLAHCTMVHVQPLNP